MTGTVGFENLKIQCVIGVHEEERTLPQEILVDVKATADLTQCSTSDNLEHAVDYTALASLCSELAQRRGYKLLEAFASEALEEILERFPVREAWIKVKKPGALPEASFSFVELSRRRQ